MQQLQKIVAIILLAATAMAFPPQQARSVVPLAPRDVSPPAYAADLARAFGISAPTRIDDTINDGVATVRDLWSARPRADLSGAARITGTVLLGLGDMRDRIAYLSAETGP